MEEQSDTPRTDAAAQFVSHFGWQVHADFARDLERELATATRERDEARAEVERLRSALGFYSQPVRYDGPNQRPIPGDPYTAADSAYMNDVCRDGGEIARAALAATEARPVNPDGLPTYDKEKALEWVAQLRDGNKEAKP